MSELQLFRGSDFQPAVGLGGLVNIQPAGDQEFFEPMGFIQVGEFKIGPCVHWGFCPEDIKKFEFIGDDLEALARELIAAKNQGRFRHWSISWSLCDESGMLLNSGHLHEDKNGELENWSLHSILDDEPELIFDA